LLEATSFRHLSRFGTAIEQSEGMGKPFQFSMRQLFLAVAMLCVGVFFFSLAARDAYNFNPVLWGLSFIAGGAGIGTIAGHPIYGALWGLLFAIAVGIFTPVILVA